VCQVLEEAEVCLALVKHLQDLEEELR